VTLAVVSAMLVGTVSYGNEVNSDSSDSSETKDSVKIEQSVVPGAVADSTELVDSVALNQIVIAYYFHGIKRCISCKKIEAYSRVAIEEGFADEIKSGQLEFRAINYDEKENQHYIKDYELYTKSLIISRVNGEEETEWKNLTKVWELLGSKEKFLDYVRKETRAFLEEG
jgi:hypothetical protein